MFMLYFQIGVFFFGLSENMIPPNPMVYHHVPPWYFNVDTQCHWLTYVYMPLYAIVSFPIISPLIDGFPTSFPSHLVQTRPCTEKRWSPDLLLEFLQFHLGFVHLLIGDLRRYSHRVHWKSMGWKKPWANEPPNAKESLRELLEEHVILTRCSNGLIYYVNRHRKPLFLASKIKLTLQERPWRQFWALQNR